MRQEIRHLVHQVDAQLIVVNADMHMHATDDKAASSTLQFMGQLIVAVFFSVFLVRL